jgi:hypothetical protein
MTHNGRFGRRRSKRVTLSIPVLISDPLADHKLPLERTHTLAVNRHGGLLALRTSVKPGQRLVLTNTVSRVSKECHVVYLGPHQQDKQQVGIEFEDPVTDFWNISFPAPGSKPLLD